MKCPAASCLLRTAEKDAPGVAFREGGLNPQARMTKTRPCEDTLESIYLSIYLYIFFFYLCLSLSISISISISLSLYLCLYLYLYLYLSIYLHG